MSEAQLFFHVSELEPGLTPTPGCEVRFVRRADPRTKKDAASRIFQLPQGTVQFEAIEGAVITGEVCPHPTPDPNPNPTYP